MKKLVVLSMLIFAAFLAACGGGVATVAPPEQTRNYQSALETASAPTVGVATEAATEPGESQGGEVTPTEPTLPPTTEAAPTEETTEIATETEAPTEAVTEVVVEGATEAATATEEVTEVVPATEVPTQTATATSTATIVPTEVPSYTPTSTPTFVPSEVPTELPTEEGGSGGADDQTATLPPTETTVPSPTATETATTLPTDTPAPTETSLPTNTATLVPTDTPVPTNTATVTNTATSIPTDTPSATAIPTDTYTPTPTFTHTATLLPSETPIPTNTPFDPPQEFTTYTSEELHLSLDYPAEWAEPAYNEPFLLISPDGTNETFPVAIITRGSPDYFGDTLGAPDVSSPQAFLEAIVQAEDNAEVSKVSGYPYPAFELITSNDEGTIRGLLFVVNDTDWIFFVGAADSEIFDLFSETTFQQMAASVVAESIEPTATPTPIPTNTPRPTSTLPPTRTPTATPVPILGETYEDEDAGFAFNYPEGAEVSEGENSVTVTAEVENVPGEIYFVRGRPEELADQGIICESRDPAEALRCVNPAVEPTFTDRYEKFGSPAWFTVQNIEIDGQINAVVSYVVAAGPEWIFIRLTAPASDYTTANLQLFQPILDSVFIEVQPFNVFGRWGFQ